MNDLVVTVRSLKRVDYLKQCLDSLEANVGLEDVDFYFYQDGAVNPFSGKRYATDEQIEASLQVFRDSRLPNKTIKIKDANVGSAIQKIEMLLELFSRYRFIMMLDNDLVFSKYYIKTIKTLFRQFERHPDVGMLQTSYFYRANTPIETLERAKKLQDKVDFGYGMRWEQGFWRAKWDRILNHFEPYILMTQDIDYTQLLRNYDPQRLHEVKVFYGEASADYVLERCVGRAGLKGLYTLALRHKTIGKIGIYSGEKKFIREGFGRTKIFDVGDVGQYTLVSDPNWGSLRLTKGSVPRNSPKGSRPSPGFMWLQYMGGGGPHSVRAPVSRKRYKLRPGVVLEVSFEDGWAMLEMLQHRRYGPPMFERTG